MKINKPVRTAHRNSGSVVRVLQCLLVFPGQGYARLLTIHCSFA